jgi:hypothetical protein
MTPRSNVVARHRVPGDLLLHPIALLATALVILNDRVLKSEVPGLVSGKLSDFAGLVYFPLFVVAVLEGLRWLVRRSDWELDWRWVLGVTLVAGTVMVLIKTWGPAGDVYRPVIGAALWPFRVPAAVVSGDGVPPVERVTMYRDPTDLISLVVLPVPVWIARRVMGTSTGRRAPAEAPV